MVKIIAICNQKGGVGKTTTAVNLAACLAAAEKKTLLIDLDPQANATTGVGIERSKVESTVYQLIIESASPSDTIQKSELPFLDVIPSENNLVGAELELAGLVSRETFLQKGISKILTHYNYIIIDCPPSLGLLTLNALTAANSLLIPVQCEYYAMEGLANLKRTVGIVKKRFNPSLKIEGIVLTMFDPRNNLSHQVSEELRKHFGEFVFQVFIPRNVRLSEAPSFGKPIILYDVKSKGAEAYFNLANELLAREVKNEHPAQSIGERVGVVDELASDRRGAGGDSDLAAGSTIVDRRD